MGVPAIWATVVVLAWGMGTLALALRFPRLKKRIVATAVAAPAVALLVYSMIRGNYSVSAWVACPPGLSRAELRSRLDDVFSQESLERLIGRRDLSSALTAREAKAHLDVKDPEGDWGVFRWSLDSGTTWTWKANAYRQLSMALADAIESRLEEGPRPR